MDIRFFDRDLRLIRVIDEYVACIFHQKWTDHGPFEIHMDRMDQGLLRAGNYILIDGDGKKSGRIEYVSASDEDGGEAVAKGHTLLYILTQRITVPPAGHAYHTFRAPAEDIIRALVRANAVDAADPARNFPHLTVGESFGRGPVLYYQSRYEGLLDAVRELAEASGLGIGIRIDQKARRLVFEVYEGRDLSGRQAGVSPVIFDAGLENVYGREYTDDMTRYKNCAYTGGQGDGADRAIYIAGDGNTGDERYEIFVDARDLADAGNLPDRAAVKLADYGRSLSYRSEVDAAGYGIKWRLGDIVMTRDREYGLELAERVTEVEETWDAAGKSVSPTLGNAEKSLLQLVQEERNGPLIEGIRGGTGPAGSTGEQGEQGEPGYSIQYRWDGTKLGVKREDETSYQYQDLQGPRGEPGSAMVPGDISDKIAELDSRFNAAGAANLAVNADTVDGFHASRTHTANTCVVRDASGHTYLGYINCSNGNNENPTVSQVVVTNGSDNFYRKASLQHLKNSLGLGTFTLGKSVPANAVFTDTNTWRGVQNNLTSTSTSDSLSANQGRLLNNYIFATSQANAALTKAKAIGQGQWGLNNAGNNLLTKKGQIIVFRLEFILTANVSSGQTIGTVPSGYRPSQEVGALCEALANNRINSFTVSPEGAITLYGNGVVNDQYQFTFTYI